MAAIKPTTKIHAHHGMMERIFSIKGWERSGFCGSAGDAEVETSSGVSGLPAVSGDWAFPLSLGAPEGAEGVDVIAPV